jgi:hypothetical protein
MMLAMQILFSIKLKFSLKTFTFAYEINSILLVCLNP